MPHPTDPGAEHSTPTQELRAEIAAAAARLIVEDGSDWASAKRKAAQAVLGERASQRAAPAEAAPGEPRRPVPDPHAAVLKIQAGLDLLELRRQPGQGEAPSLEADAAREVGRVPGARDDVTSRACLPV